MNESEFQKDEAGADVTLGTDAVVDKAMAAEKADSDKPFFVGILKLGDRESEPFASNPDMDSRQPLAIATRAA